MHRNLEDLEIKAAQSLALEAVAKGWKAGWTRQEDNAGNPSITLHIGKRNGSYYTLTWHTRETGTYRLFSKMFRKEPQGPWLDAPSLKVIRAGL